MSDTQEDRRSRQAWELAGRQHGVVARRQLLALGFSKRQIEHRVARGRLHIVMHGVYAVGWPKLTQKRRWMAAVLACRGDAAPDHHGDAALSHRSAAALWEIGTERAGFVEISVRRRCELRRRGLSVHGRPTLAPADIVLHDGIPVTSPVRTLVDLASELGPVRVERAVNEADKRDLIDPEMLRLRLNDFAGQPGAPLLRRVLDKRTFRLSDSDLEIYFRPIAAKAGLPPPLSKQIVNGWEVDFFWPDLRLVIETDGLRYHRTPSAQARDAKRDRTHAIAGMTPLRFTHYEIRYEPSQVRDELAAAVHILRKRVSDIDHT